MNNVRVENLIRVGQLKDHDSRDDQKIAEAIARLIDSLSDTE
jgi:hypothetical protein